MDTIAIFFAIDDFCQAFEPWWEQARVGVRAQAALAPGGRLCLSEVMTLVAEFHLSGYRTFKHYDLGKVLKYQRPYFPGRVSYNRFVEWLQGSRVPLCPFLINRFGRCTGVSFIDLATISGCHNRRIRSHKVMAGFATRGKSSVD